MYNSSFNVKLFECSKELIKADGLTICSLSRVKDGIVANSLLPYMALYCRSAQEFFGEKIIKSEDDQKIYDIRNGIKLYVGQYSKSSVATARIDMQQDSVFRKRLLFPALGKLNVHYNLGIYVDRNGHVIGDTQLQNYFLNLSGIGQEEKGDEELNLSCFMLGKMLGEKIRYILVNRCDSESMLKQAVVDTCAIECPRYGYIDLNTNIGFVEHMLPAILPENSLWLLRVKYLVAHTAWSGLRRIDRHFENIPGATTKLSEISSLLDESAKLFPSAYRNSMMHYDLCYGGYQSVSEEFFDPNIPFFGLVESNFNGRLHSDFFSDIDSFLQDIEQRLSYLFQIETRKIKWDIG